MHFRVETGIPARSKIRQTETDQAVLKKMISIREDAAAASQDYRSNTSTPAAAIMPSWKALIGLLK